MITQEECLELLKNTWKIDAIAGMLSENHLLLTENDGIPASNLLEIIYDYNIVLILQRHFYFQGSDFSQLLFSVRSISNKVSISVVFHNFYGSLWIQRVKR